MKIAKSLEDSRLFTKGVNQTIKNKTKEHKGGFRDMLLVTVSASWLGDMFVEKGVMCAYDGVIQAD